MSNKSVKIGVIGVGHLGQHHVKHFVTLPNANLIGIFDLNQNRAQVIATQNKVSLFPNLESLLSEVDAVSVVTPTPTHAYVAEKCIMAGKHVFIEKPVTKSIEEANELLRSVSYTHLTLPTKRIV